MSDITGPPASKPVEPVSRSTGKTVNVSKDSQHTETQTRNEKGETSSKSEQAEQLRTREPAVSISASAAHLEVGEQLKEQIRKIDLEGRPIIVTETATFALKPDAGIRAGDDVKLEIIEAGNKVSADLLEMNGHKIDPPIRLSLVVIAIHTKDEPVPTTAESTRSAPLPQTGGYGNLSIRKVSQDSSPLPLTSMFSRSTAMPDLPESAILSTGQGLEKSTTTPLTSGRNNSEDLATLLAAQQDKTSNGNIGKTGFQNIQTPYRSTPPSFRPSTVVASPNVNQELLQPSVTAYSLTGKKMPVQLVATTEQSASSVLSIQPLPPGSIGASSQLPEAYKGNTSPLAVVETNKGSFIASLSEAQALLNRSVNVVPATETTAPTTTNQTYDAMLMAPKTSTPQKVYVSFSALPNDGVRPAVEAVQTLRTYPSPSGPIAELKLETSRGDILVALPEAERPQVGWEVQIQTIKPSEQAPLETTALTSLSAHNWPSLDQSFVSLAGTDPLMASQLAEKGAQGGGKLTNSLLFFLSAAGRGDPGAWLGKDVEAVLEKQNKTLVEMFKSELGKVMSAATDASAEWRPILLPLDMRSPDLPLIALLIGQPHRPLDPDEQGTRGGQGQEEQEDAQRFILEVRFSVLGAIQFDGMIKGQQFDLAMHTERPISSSLKSEAIELFDRALGASGFSGRLNIVETSPFPVDVQQALDKSLA